MAPELLVYGANGYTAGLVAQAAADTGVRLVLAGRSSTKVAAAAAPFGYAHRAFSLDDPRALRAGLDGAGVLLLCAGPFIHTAPAAVTACLDLGIHYLDITGEIPVFETMAALDNRARSSDVMLMPGAGFDVVPSDCLAAHLKRRLPTATRLRLAFKTVGGVSRGTARTTVEQGGRGGRARRNGLLESEPLAARTLQVDFGRGVEEATSIPWGDLVTAWHTTGIPNIETYAAFGRGAGRWLRAAGALSPVLRLPLVRRGLQAAMGRMAGPGESARASGYALLWGEVRDDAGHSAVARMRTPEAYHLTAQTALRLALRALHGDAPPGFQTPARAYGPDFILDFAGVSREDL